MDGHVFEEIKKKKLCPQRARVNKNTVIVFDMVSVQNLLLPFCCVFEKKFSPKLSPVWRHWQPVFIFSHMFIKLKEEI